MSGAASPGLERLEALHPEGVAALRAAEQAGRTSTDGELLDLCLAHVDALLSGADPGRPPCDDRERAFVEFAEQYATSVASVGAEQVARLRAHAADADVYGFICALYVAEMARRVELVAGEVLA